MTLEIQRQNYEEFSRAFDIYWLKTIKVWLYIKPIFRLSKYYELEQKYIKNGYVKIFQHIMNKNEEKYSNQKNNNNNEENDKPQIFIEHLYRHRDVLSEGEINDEVNSFILGVSNVDPLHLSASHKIFYRLLRQRQ